MSDSWSETARYADLSHRSICSIVLGAIFDTKLGPRLRAGQYERIRRVDDENNEMAIQLP